jgi:hypothetical protein
MCVNECLYVCVQGYFSFEKGSRMQRVPQNSARVVVIVISMPGKKFPERSSSLRPCEKEPLERHPGAFRHKNTPVCVCVCVSVSQRHQRPLLTLATASCTASFLPSFHPSNSVFLAPPFKVTSLQHLFRQSVVYLSFKVSVQY